MLHAIVMITMIHCLTCRRRIPYGLPVVATASAPCYSLHCHACLHPSFSQAAVLAFRKTTGKVSGTIQLNGSPLTREAAAFLHFAEQEDIHLPSATVREAMQFSAALRMPHDVTPKQRDGVLQRVARLLELGPLLDRVVGSLSRSEMKRLTIAVELAALPSVIFLDEPTSFLSASSAAIVMRALRRVAATGRTVICTSELRRLLVVHLRESSHGGIAATATCRAGRAIPGDLQVKAPTTSTSKGGASHPLAATVVAG